MDFGYTQDQEELRQEVRAFIDGNVGQGLLDEMEGGEEGGRGPEYRELVKKVADKGWIGISWPKEYGGQSGSRIDQYIVEEEFMRGGIAVGGAGSGAPAILAAGTEEQKEYFIPGMIRGEIIFALGFTEPQAGADLAGLQCRAVRDGDDFVINGQKMYTSAAHYASHIYMMCRTDPDAPRHRGITIFLVPMDTPGIEVRPLKTMTGHAEFNEVFFTDVRVPMHQIVGQRGQGWFVANATLGHERGMLGDPDALENRLEALIALMQEERLGQGRAIDNPVLRDRLVALQAEVAAMKYNGMRILSNSLRGEPGGMAKLIVKLQSCELAHQISALAIDAMGELGILYHHSPREREGGAWQWNYMFQLGLIIGGGTAQIQKNIIAERGLEMPREPKLAKISDAAKATADMPRHKQGSA